MTEKTNLVSSQHFQEEQHASPLGHFAVGFSVGVITGAIGYYLVGTEQGKRIVADLKEEWHELTKVAEGESVATEAKPVALPGWWLDLKKTIQDIAGKEPVSAPKVKKVTPVKAKPAPRKPQTTPKKNTFKGI